MARNWLITGGCGFIGTRLIQDLLQDGDRVRVLDNLSVGTRDDLSSVAEFTETHADESSWTHPLGLVIGDIQDESTVASAAGGADVVVHLAAQSGVGPSVEDPRHDMMSNVVGTFNLLEACRSSGTKRFVYASSGAAVGEVQPPLREDLLPRPISPYGTSKLCTEMYAYCYARTFGVDTVGLRFGNVYGPGSTHKGSVVAKFIRRALGGEVLEVYGDGTQTRDFIFIDDLIDSIRRSASAPVGGEVFQIATSRETTVDEITEELVRVLESRGVGPIEVQHVGERLGDVQRNYSDTTKALELLGWQASTDLTTGLEATVDWFLSR